jgi:hypothetical protein
MADYALAKTGKLKLKGEKDKRYVSARQCQKCVSFNFCTLSLAVCSKKKKRKHRKDEEDVSEKEKQLDILKHGAKFLLSHFFHSNCKIFDNFRWLADDRRLQ